MFVFAGSSRGGRSGMGGRGYSGGGMQTGSNSVPVGNMRTW